MTSRTTNTTQRRAPRCFFGVPATLVRHYAAPDGRGGRFTKSPKHQLDLLAEGLPADLGRVNNGYLQASRIRDLGTTAAAVEQNFNQIRIGVHDDAQVVLGCSRDGAVEGKTRMAQVFTSTLATGWHVDAVDREGSVGSDSSIALDKSGNPHISYFDATQVDLRYAYRDAARWHIEKVDTSGDVGYYTSLALDTSGNSHISYYDSTNSALKHIERCISTRSRGGFTRSR